MPRLLNVTNFLEHRTLANGKYDGFAVIFIKVGVGGLGGFFASDPGFGQQSDKGACYAPICRKNAAIPRPISAGESSWMK